MGCSRTGAGARGGRRTSSGGCRWGLRFEGARGRAWGVDQGRWWGAPDEERQTQLLRLEPVESASFTNPSPIPSLPPPMQPNHQVLADISLSDDQMRELLQLRGQLLESLGHTLSERSGLAERLFPGDDGLMKGLVGVSTKRNREKRASLQAPGLKAPTHPPTLSISSPIDPSSPPKPHLKPQTPPTTGHAAPIRGAEPHTSSSARAAGNGTPPQNADCSGAATPGAPASLHQGGYYDSVAHSSLAAREAVLQIQVWFVGLGLMRGQCW